MHGPINVKSPNNISKWEIGFNSAFKGLIIITHTYVRKQKEVPAEFPELETCPKVKSYLHIIFFIELYNRFCWFQILAP